MFDSNGANYYPYTKGVKNFDEGGLFNFFAKGIRRYVVVNNQNVSFTYNISSYRSGPLMDRFINEVILPATLANITLFD